MGRLLREVLMGLKLKCKHVAVLHGAVVDLCILWRADVGS